MIPFIITNFILSPSIPPALFIIQYRPKSNSNAPHILHHPFLHSFLPYLLHKSLIQSLLLLTSNLIHISFVQKQPTNHHEHHSNPFPYLIIALATLLPQYLFHLGLSNNKIVYRFISCLSTNALTLILLLFRITLESD